MEYLNVFSWFVSLSFNISALNRVLMSSNLLFGRYMLLRLYSIIQTTHYHNRFVRQVYKSTKWVEYCIWFSFCWHPKLVVYLILDKFTPLTYFIFSYKSCAPSWYSDFSGLRHTFYLIFRVYLFLFHHYSLFLYTWFDCWNFLFDDLKHKKAYLD